MLPFGKANNLTNRLRCLLLLQCDNVTNQHTMPTLYAPLWLLSAFTKDWMYTYTGRFLWWPISLGPVFRCIPILSRLFPWRKQITEDAFFVPSNSKPSGCSIRRDEVWVARRNPHVRYVVIFRKWRFFLSTILESSILTPFRWKPCGKRQCRFRSHMIIDKYTSWGPPLLGWVNEQK